MSSAAEKKHAPLVDVVAGGLGSAAAKSLLAPFQRIVILQQLGEHRNLNTFQLVSHIKRNEGWRGFWRGNLTSMIIRVPYSGMQFVTYSRLKFLFQDLSERYVRPPKGDDGDIRNASRHVETAELFLMKCGAGGISATIAGVAVYPGEVVRLRLMSGEKQFKSIMGTIRIIHAETNSMKNFYRGLGASLLQRVPDILINFATYETIKYKLMEKDFLKDHPSYKNAISTTIGGATAAVASIAVCFPLDVAKRRIGMSGQGKSGIVHRGVRECLWHVYRYEGIRGLYGGASVEIMRCVPQVVLMWFFIEATQKFLTNYGFGSDAQP
ncbi:mitochondrial carrier protein, putative [Trypanosoma brucei gambiense DAL972]|uniref:Mitochondrial carrier protein, putative n=3 Tax=Trypanosoma brucei TaxID=5691 RepID=Q387U3_TRYB2|nr:mitochondrial carrier protein, putative [Trypanosoma brucei gambiense DAL972]XP_828041.1 mitochondrial carrier protein, putative [Trypanosoma brucei brucei TREU927]EAN78929.1 mitochondrial carrier protein, putative [Trypanosoma brucei brucei TREU927]RHW69663.1 mitochondrial carrier protein [Trypanosoma brucei equiperdum]CBH16816.1 mitochondrial carrier protein, putative [Trypanosoma brucei gambiense DAL972]|eukprot:XP_011779080.1 mitochondrial carrier protein, putative [Trypanosoma brucei gambiense DAL972]